MKEKINNEKYLPVSVIFAAKDGDEEAMAAILKHYDKYINELSRRNFTDKFGQTHSYIIEDIKRSLQIHLTINFSKFNISNS